MTFASAASTLGDTWNGRLSDNIEVFSAWPEAKGMRFSPPTLAPSDLSQGRVLLAVEDVILAFDLQRLLREAGYRVVGPATTTTEVQRMIQRGDIDCAILDLDVDRRAPLPIADLLAFANVPFVYLTTGVFGPIPSRHKRRPIVEKPISRDALLAAIGEAMATPRETIDRGGEVAGAGVVPWERVYPPI